MWHAVELCERISCFVTSDVVPHFEDMVRSHLKRDLLESPDLFSLHKSARLREALYSLDVCRSAVIAGLPEPQVIDLSTAASTSAGAIATVACLQQGHYKTATRMCKRVTSVVYPAGGHRLGQMVLSASSPAAIMLIGSSHVRSGIQSIHQSTSDKAAAAAHACMRTLAAMGSQFARASSAVQMAARPSVAAMGFEVASALLAAIPAQPLEHSHPLLKAVSAGIQGGMRFKPVELEVAEGVHNETQPDSIVALMQTGIVAGDSSLQGLMHRISSTNEPSGSADVARNAES